MTVDEEWQCEIVAAIRFCTKRGLDWLPMVAFMCHQAWRGERVRR